MSWVKKNVINLSSPIKLPPKKEIVYLLTFILQKILKITYSNYLSQNLIKNLVFHFIPLSYELNSFHYSQIYLV